MNRNPDTLWLWNGAGAWWIAILWLCSAVTLPIAMHAQVHQPPDKPPATEEPATPPDTDQLISSYEGQNVSAVILAGRPDLDLEKLAPLMTQKANEPFARAKVEETALALKQAGPFDQVHVEVQPDARGATVYFILEPGDWYGIFTFPGAQKFPYAQLVQTSDYPPQMPYSAEEGPRITSIRWTRSISSPKS